MITSYHAKYFANELTKQDKSEGIQRLSMSLFNACVDLNPHQIEAALFALRTPLSSGILLADEVGLGKTIEAGLVLCQFWAERKRRLLVICPASLRKQWSLELEEKFNIPTFIIDAKSYRNFKENNQEPFFKNGVIILSVNYASKMAEEIKTVNWDAVIIDESHKLRNAYRSSNKMGQAIKWALDGRFKILLTATPLQNSLLELYGLSTVISDHIFGEIGAFRSQYMSAQGSLQDLRNRLRQFCKRTLRKQVVEYINYTERRAITRPFKPTDEEQKLYETISSFLLRENTYSIPKRQKQLTTLVLRKILASSSSALAGTLETIKRRLEEMKDDNKNNRPSIAESIISDEDIEEDLIEDDFESNNSEISDIDRRIDEEEQSVDIIKLNKEIEEINSYIGWAKSIGIDTKTKALLNALEIGFAEMERMGAKRKAVVFTESRRTESYLKRFLEANGYLGKIVTFDGSNSNPESKNIYETWLKSNIDSGRATGSKAIDIRTALIEHFDDNAEIMIATEAASEGINLQFCSLVINYDLPWNPQRIEQRIGRCHRYGQKHDVVVINFLNEKNEADRRVLELLEEKFNLFNGVFGASDEVLGTVESGVDFEKRILDIYQQCRTPDEIDKAFKKLREEMEEKIQCKMDDTRSLLFEHFDEDVHARLKMQLDDTKRYLDKFQSLFWRLTRFILDRKAVFENDRHCFVLERPPLDGLKPGRYHLISKERLNVTGEYLYRLSHPLGEYVIEQGKNAPTPVSEVLFDISNHPAKISVIEKLKGKHGRLCLQRLIIDSFRHEEYLLFSGIDSDGNSLDQEICEKFFNCDGSVSGETSIDEESAKRLKDEAERHVKATISRSLESNNRFFNEEREKLEKWADDMVLASEKALKDTKNQLKILNRQARQAATIQEQHEIQSKIRELEKLQRKQRRKIFDVEDEIIEKRDKLIDALEKRMSQKTKTEPLFTIKWRVV